MRTPFFGRGAGMPQQIEIKKISFSDAKKLMATLPAYRIVDVREPHEYANGHIRGAISFPVNLIHGGTVNEKLPDKDMPLFVYCKSGQRSKRACVNLVALGYNCLYNMGGLIGGVFEIERGPYI